MADKEKLLAFAGLVAMGKTTREAGKELGLSERTAYRWAKTKAYKRALARLQDDAVGAFLALLLASHKESVGTLIELQREGHSDAVRLRAAEVVLNLALKGHESMTRRRELEAIEEIHDVEARLSKRTGAGISGGCE